MTLASLYQLLCADHLQAQGIVDTLDMPILLLDERLRVIKANPSFLTDFHLREEDVIGSSIFELGDGQWDIPELRLLLADVIPKSRAIIGYEVRHDFPGIGPRTVLVSARRLQQPAEADSRLFIGFTDVTENRRLEREFDILLSESQHRVNNALVVVHAIAYQTPTEGLSAQEYRDAYLSRLDAFLSTENLIGRVGETGVTLAALVDDALQAVPLHKLEIRPGPEVRLSRAQVRPLRMIFHELTTNAFKYGALSKPQGIVRIEWGRVAGEGKQRVRLVWREEIESTLPSPPGKGFGLSMIERTAHNNQWGAKLRFDPTGLCAEIDFPESPPDNGGT